MVVHSLYATPPKIKGNLHSESGSGPPIVEHVNGSVGAGKPVSKQFIIKYLVALRSEERR